MSSSPATIMMAASLLAGLASSVFAGTTPQADEARRWLGAAQETAAAREADGDFAAAETALRALVERMERAGIESGRDYGLALAAIARLRGMQGDDDGFNQLTERAVTAMEQELGAVHHEIAAHQRRLADWRVHQGRGDDAFELYRRAVHGFEVSPEPDPLQYSRALAGYAEQLVARRELAEAVTIFERSLALEEIALGFTDPLVAWVIADLLIELDRLDEAIPWLERADGSARSAPQSQAIALLGAFRRRDGGDAAAVAELRASLASSPSDQALRELARILRNRLERLQRSGASGAQLRATCNADVLLHAGALLRENPQSEGALVEACLRGLTRSHGDDPR